jgi:hypothetical protein
MAHWNTWAGVSLFLSSSNSWVMAGLVGFGFRLTTGDILFTLSTMTGGLWMGLSEIISITRFDTALSGTCTTLSDTITGILLMVELTGVSETITVDAFFLMETTCKSGFVRSINMQKT